MVPIEEDNLEALYNLSQSLSLITDSIESFGHARAFLQRLVQCDVLLIFVNDEERECLVAPAAYNGHVNLTQHEVSISYDHAIVKDLMISKQCAWSRSPETPIVPEMTRELFVPLLSLECTLGCLYFAKAEAAPFTVNEITWAKLAAHLLAISLERAQWTRKYAQAQKQVERWHEGYLSLLESFPFPTAIVDLANDQIIEANEEFIRVLADNRQALLSKDFSAMCADVISFLDAVRKAEIGSHAIRLLSADGERVKGTAKWAPMIVNGQQMHVVAFLPNVSASWDGKSEADNELRRKIEGLEGFVTAISHDLKVPIQNLRGYVAFLAEDFRGSSPSQARDYIDRILANIEQMEQLTTGMLNFYRADQPDATFEWVPAVELVEGVLRSLTDQLKRHKAKVVFARDLPLIFCNKIAMTQVFVNLITNALKYANKPKRPQIEIGYRTIHSGYEFYVKDHGIGIDAENRERIFQPFYASQQGHDDSSTGIGLAVVKKIVELHNGNIWVEPNPTGGAIFKFILPTRNEAA